MSSDVKILRLSTGEDVIAKVGENDQGKFKQSVCNYTSTMAPGQTCTINDVIV